MTYTVADERSHDRECRFEHMPDDAGLHEYDVQVQEVGAVAVATICEWAEKRTCSVCGTIVHWPSQLDAARRCLECQP